MSVKLGEAYQLGNHVLLCGDSADEYTVKMFLGDRKITAVVCDPPYGVRYTESKEFLQNSTVKHKPIINDGITSESEYYKFSYSWLNAVMPHLDKRMHCMCLVPTLCYSLYGKQWLTSVCVLGNS